MSKYIDELTELICDTVRTVFPNASLDDGYDVADEVIAKLPTIEVNEDCISRDYVRLIESDEDAYYGDWNEDYEKGFSDAIDKVLDAPSVVPKEKIGRRKEEEMQSVYGKKIRLTCCECGNVVDVSESAYPYEKYCRYCGAKMKG